MTDLAAAVAERSALDVTADLSVDVDGTEVTVESYTDRLFVEVDSVTALLRAARATSGRSWLRRTGRLLAAADLTAEFRVAGRRVALAGAGADPGRLGRRLGGIDLRATGLFGAVLTAPT